MQVISMLCSLFFFFKQKTAYEMRISDWSSDVCSSDLLDHRLARRAQRAAASRQVRSRRLYRLSDRVARTYRAGRACAGGVPAVGALLCRRGGHGGVEAQVPATDADDDGRADRHPQGADRSQPACDDAALCLVPRSDEHTSELQSLMRISYAVF